MRSTCHRENLGSITVFIVSHVNNIENKGKSVCFVHSQSSKSDILNEKVTQEQYSRIKLVQTAHYQFTLAVAPRSHTKSHAHESNKDSPLW